MRRITPYFPSQMDLEAARRKLNVVFLLNKILEICQYVAPLIQGEKEKTKEIFTKRELKENFGKSFKFLIQAYFYYWNGFSCSYSVVPCWNEIAGPQKESWYRP